ncbi:response regulator [candidate division KSB1 bacterium]|nr:response regulator [candidate division KSB1 bacterium]
MNFRILVVDDEAMVCKTIHNIFRNLEYTVDSIESGKSAMELIERRKPDLILLDLNLKDIHGLDVLKTVKQKHPEIIIIMITGYATVESAIDAMKAGAYDYVQKPFNVDELRKLVSNALETVKLKKEVEELRQRQMEKNKINKIIGNSEEIQNVLSLVQNFAPSDTTILIEGESGTGKELIAEYIHYLSPRYAKPYVTINCSAVPKDLLETELFGYEKGAFTGSLPSGKMGLLERADTGTIFLDEIGEMSVQAQAKMLRVLEYGDFYRVGNPAPQKVDLRIIAASNIPLQTLVKQKKFRNDLYYRLNIAKIELPPLRDRKSDIIPLVKFFIDHFNKQLGKRVTGISSDVEDALLAHPLRGNVRELRNIIERVMLLTNSDIIRLNDIELAGVIPQESAFSIFVKLNKNSNGNLLHKASLDIISKTLALVKNNKSQAAKLLGVPRSTLRHYLEKFDHPQ